jgi:hypothetical protein
MTTTSETWAPPTEFAEDLYERYGLTCPPRWGTPRHPDRPSLGAEAVEGHGQARRPADAVAEVRVDVALEIDPETGLFAHREVGLSVSRQQGKTELTPGRSGAPCAGVAAAEHRLRRADPGHGEAAVGGRVLGEDLHLGPGPVCAHPEEQRQRGDPVSRQALAHGHHREHGEGGPRSRRWTSGSSTRRSRTRTTAWSRRSARPCSHARWLSCGGRRPAAPRRACG